MNTVGSHILVTGGVISNNTFVGINLELFDGLTWQELPFKLSYTYFYHCAVTVSETEVIIIGSPPVGKVAIEKYDIFNSWFSCKNDVQR